MTRLPPDNCLEAALTVAALALQTATTPKQRRLALEQIEAIKRRLAELKGQAA
jgi:UDP-N-acetylmuramyl pentapeptide synthase